MTHSFHTMQCFSNNIIALWYSYLQNTCNFDLKHIGPNGPSYSNFQDSQEVVQGRSSRLHDINMWEWCPPGALIPWKKWKFFLLDQRWPVYDKNHEESRSKSKFFFLLPSPQFEINTELHNPLQILVFLQQLLILNNFRTMAKLFITYPEFGHSSWIILKLSSFSIYSRFIYIFWVITQWSHKLLVLWTMHYLISLDL